MPHKHETDRKLIPKDLKKTSKLTEAQKQEIKENKENLSSYKLAELYKVSRRTIQFILDPQKKLENYKKRLERGGSSQYYNKEKQTRAMKETRRYRTELEKNGLLLDNPLKGIDTEQT